MEKRIAEKKKSDLCSRDRTCSIKRIVDWKPTQETPALKAACYNDYYRRGGLAVRNGQPASAYKDFPFRILMVFKSAERRDNIGARLLKNNPSVLTQVWLTTMKEIIAEPVGAIRIRPLDYRNATRSASAGTSKSRMLGL